jgi:glycosyltransferase involved in cell wall biosynthesis
MERWPRHDAIIRKKGFIMKILYFTKLPPVSGSRVHAGEFVSAAQAIPGVELHWCLLDKKPSPTFFQLGKNNRLIRLLFLPLSLGLKIHSLLFEDLGTYARELRTQCPDVIIIRSSENIGIILFTRWKKIPFIIESNAAVSELLKHQSGLVARLLSISEARLYRFAAHIVCVSSTLAERFISLGIESAKLTVVPNGVDPSKFFPRLKAPSFLEKYHLENRTVIGFSGHLSSWHGVDFLFSVFSALCKTIPNLTLLVIGDKKPSHAVFDSIPEHTIITGTIAHENMPDLLSVIDIFIIPYPKIDFFYFSPLKLFEAMGMGLAIVASDQGQISEVITPGVSGMLFSPGNQAECLGKTRELIENPGLRQKLGSGARTTVEQRHTWNHNAETIVKICQNILSY